MPQGTLVDSNVLLDVLTEDQRWMTWSSDALANAAEAGPLYINPIIYSEVSIRFTTVEALDDALPWRDFRREALPWAAADPSGTSSGQRTHSGMMSRWSSRRSSNRSGSTRSSRS